MAQIHQELKKYKYSNFIDYFISRDNFNYGKHDAVLMVLSEEKTPDHYKYVFHVFILLDKGYTVWIDKFTARNVGYTLREKHPAIKLENSPFIALIEKREKIIIFTSDCTEKSDDFLYKSKKAVKFIFLTDDDSLYFTHENKDVITRLKFYNYTTKSSEKSSILVEEVGEISVGYKYKD